MATNFWTKIAINSLCDVNDSDCKQLVIKGGLSGRPTECRYWRYPAPIRDVAMATTFLSFGGQPVTSVV